MGKGLDGLEGGGSWEDDWEDDEALVELVKARRGGPTVPVDIEALLAELEPPVITSQNQ